MRPRNLLKKVSIMRHGAVLLGKKLACDGFDGACKIGAISHAHGDHTQGLHSSLHFYDSILVSPATRHLLIATEGRWLERRTNLVPLPVRKPFRCQDEQITFYPATHILGSVKIFLKQTDRTEILYTGDFRMPQKPIHADILVIEATYGNPEWNRLYGKEFAVRQLIRLVKQRIRSKSIQIFATQGKVQEVMRILRKADLQVPFLTPRKIYAWSLVYKKYGKDLGECLSLESQEAKEIQQSKGGYILFFTVGSEKPDFNKYFCIKISGLEPRIPFHEITKNYYSITISDHADSAELLGFVKKANPKLVITDGSRQGDPRKLADEIKRKLGIKAYPMPFQ